MGVEIEIEPKRLARRHLIPRLLLARGRELVDPAVPLLRRMAFAWILNELMKGLVSDPYFRRLGLDVRLIEDKDPMEYTREDVEMVAKAATHLAARMLSHELDALRVRRSAD